MQRNNSYALKRSVNKGKIYENNFDSASFLKKNFLKVLWDRSREDWKVLHWRKYFLTIIEMMLQEGISNLYFGNHEKNFQHYNFPINYGTNLFQLWGKRFCFISPLSLNSSNSYQFVLYECFRNRWLKIARLSWFDKNKLISAPPELLIPYSRT